MSWLAAEQLTVCEFVTFEPDGLCWCGGLLCGAAFVPIKTIGVLQHV